MSSRAGFPSPKILTRLAFLCASCKPELPRPEVHQHGTVIINNYLRITNYRWNERMDVPMSVLPKCGQRPSALHRPGGETTVTWAPPVQTGSAAGGPPIGYTEGRSGSEVREHGRQFYLKGVHGAVSHSSSMWAVTSQCTLALHGFLFVTVTTLTANYSVIQLPQVVILNVTIFYTVI